MSSSWGDYSGALIDFFAREKKVTLVKGEILP